VTLALSATMYTYMMSVNTTTEESPVDFGRSEQTGFISPATTVKTNTTHEHDGRLVNSQIQMCTSIQDLNMYQVRQESQSSLEFAFI